MPKGLSSSSGRTLISVIRRTTDLHPWLLFLTPTLSPTCFVVNTPRVPPFIWLLIRRTSSVASAFGLEANAHRYSTQVWRNVGKRPAEIRSKQIVGWVWLVAVCFFNTVPLLIISILANLASVRSQSFLLSIGLILMFAHSSQSMCRFWTRGPRARRVPSLSSPVYSLPQCLRCSGGPYPSSCAGSRSTWAPTHTPAWTAPSLPATSRSC